MKKLSGKTLFPVHFSNLLKSFLGVLFIIALSLAVLIILIFILSGTPLKALYFFFIGPFINSFSFSYMINASVPLMLGALGVTIAMKTGNLNLGGEGQVYLGAFVTTVTAVSLSKFGVTGIITACIAGSVFSAVIAGLSGFCKAKWKVNELITTFLLSNVVILFVNYLVTGPFQDPGSSLQTTRKIMGNLYLPVFGVSGISSGIVIAIIFAVIVFIFLERTKTGYEFRIAGFNEIFARYGGINTKLNTTLAMALSGGLYGLAGSVAVLGTYHSVIKEFSAGMGWNGLAAALIAGFNIPALIPSVLFFAWIGAGARAATQNTGLTNETALVVQALVLLLASSYVLKNIFKGRNIK